MICTNQSDTKKLIEKIEFDLARARSHNIVGYWEDDITGGCYSWIWRDNKVTRIPVTVMNDGSIVL